MLHPPKVKRQILFKWKKWKERCSGKKTRKVKIRNSKKNSKCFPTVFLDFYFLLLIFKLIMLAVTILGNNSAVPAFDRHPTSQVITMDGTNFLVDCGEGTQIQMINYKIRRSKISHIFISHLHGDHYFGLPGLITSFGLLGHQQELNVF